MKSFLDWLVEAAMTFPQALQIFGLSQAPSSEKELSTLFKKLAMKRHPDHGGSTREMQELNAAKDILKKNLGSDGTRAYSKSQKSAGSWQENLKRDEEFIAKALERLFDTLDVVTYRKWFESHFSKKFTIDLKKGTYSSLFTNVPLPYVEMTAYSEGHAEVFTMKLTATVLNAAKNVSSSLGGKNTTFAYYVTAEALVGGKKQVMARQKSRKVNDTLPLTNPDVVFPSIKLRKIINGNARKGSKMARRDFASIFETRWGCETGKNWWLFEFNVDADNIAYGIAVERVTLQREGFYTFGSRFWVKDTAKKYGVWNSSNEARIECEYMPESRETADFIESVFAYARKTKDLKKIADFVKKGSKAIYLRDRLANES